MKTKFITLGKTSKIFKETIFTHYIISGLTVCEGPTCTVNNFENVLHIGYDKRYGDVFKCWDNDDIPNNFTIYFGTKGDEFNQ